RVIHFAEGKWGGKGNEAQDLGIGGGNSGHPHSHLNSGSLALAFLVFKPIELAGTALIDGIVLPGHAFGLYVEANLTIYGEKQKDTAVANLPRSRIMKGDCKALLPRDVQLQALTLVTGMPNMEAGANTDNRGFLMSSSTSCSAKSVN
ncbi:unnamed protein product, partial [Clonostachys rosea]